MWTSRKFDRFTIEQRHRARQRCSSNLRSFTVRAVLPERFPARDLRTRFPNVLDKSRNANHLEEAALLIDQALALHLKWAPGWWSLAERWNTMRNDHPEAAAAFRHLLPLASEYGMVLVMLGSSEFELGQDDKILQTSLMGEITGYSCQSAARQVLLFHEGARDRGVRASSSRRYCLLASSALKASSRGRSSGSWGLAMLRINGENAPPHNLPGCRSRCKSRLCGVPYK